MNPFTTGQFHFLLLLFLSVLTPISSSAWQESFLLSLTRTPSALQNPDSAAIRKPRPSTRLNSLKDASSDAATVPDDVNLKRLIEVTSEVTLPFSREVAFDAYSDLTRQSSWSPWLHSVEYTDETKMGSKWTMKLMGVKYSWTATAVRNERPGLIQWQSTSGLQNFGMVRFTPHDDPENPTLMTIRMTFVAPRAAASVFRRSKSIANFVRDQMITESMVNFRDVLTADLQEDKKGG